jgi:hypothetical protein
MTPRSCAIAVLLGASFIATPCLGQSFFNQPALSAEQLDGMRGGFIGEDGLKIALGIERLVHVNGELAGSTVLRIPDLSAISARGIELEGSPRSLIQNGPGNVLDPGVLAALGPGMLTLVQNSLNSQLIVGTTRIDITVSGTRSLRLSETLSGLNVQLHSR